MSPRILFRRSNRRLFSNRKEDKRIAKGGLAFTGDLAEGICTQALISRIEKGDIYPSATALYQISNMLGVDVSYFFEIGTTPRLDYLL